MRALRLDKNPVGRDYVVGDIHGHFDLLRRLLEQIQFNPENDRLFSVGDLIDRGPQSLEACHFLEQDWFYSVAGNHERLMLDSLAKVPGMFDLWMQVGGNWSQFASPEQLEKLADAINDMPLLIEVLTDHGLAGIVHADVPFEKPWGDLFEHTEAGKLNDKDMSTLLWSRNRYRKLSLSILYPDGPPAPVIDDLHCLYVGHSIVNEPQPYGNVMFIDTGAFSAGGLSAIDLNSGKVYRVDSDEQLPL